MYVETQREVKLDKDGRIEEESVKVYESYPGLPGQPRWERLISKNGKPCRRKRPGGTGSRAHKKANEMVRRLGPTPAKERARQEREWEKLRARPGRGGQTTSTPSSTIQMTGRESIEGHDTIAFTLTPKPDSKPKTREGDLMKHFSVRAWISETDYELVRLEAEAIDNVSFGLGVLGAPAQGSAVCRSCAARSTARCGFRPWPITAAAPASGCCGRSGAMARPSIPATRSSPSTPRRASTIRNNESRPARRLALLA